MNQPAPSKLLSPLACLLALAAGCGDSTTGTTSTGGAGKNTTPQRPAGEAPTTSTAGPAKVHTVPEGTPLKLAFICNNTTDFWNFAKAGLDKAEREKGIKVTFMTPARSDVALQKTYIEQCLTEGYHGIAISPVSAEAQAPDLDDAAAKLNVICQDSDCPASKRLAYVGTNNFDAGKALGEEIVKLLPQGGKMAVFVGTFSADNARERLRGIEAAVKDKNITIVAKKEDNKDEALARRNVEDVLNTYPDVKLVAGLWAYNGPAIAGALEGSSKAGKVLGVAFDEFEGTLTAIEKGTITCTVVQQPFEFGYQSALLLDALCRKGTAALPKDGRVATAIRVIDKDNVKKFKEEAASLKK